MINSTVELFIELIRVSIGVSSVLSRSPSECEWGEMYDMAKKQSVVGVCFAGVQKLQAQWQEPPEMLYLTWMGMAAKIQQRNETLNKQCVELQKRFMTDGLVSAILKGQGIAQLYVENLRGLRQSGDIDIWVKGGFKNVYNFTKSLCKDDNYGYLNTHLEIFKDTEVEVHWRPCNLPNIFANRCLQKWIIENEIEIYNNQCILGDRNSFSTPSVRLNRIFILLHAYKHMFDEGLGIRHLMDLYYVFMTEILNENDREEFINIILKFRVMKITRAIMWIMKEMFGMPITHMIVEPDERSGRMIFSKIIAGGNFGRYESSVKQVSDNIHIQSIMTRLQHNWSMIRVFPLEFIWSPIWLVYHFIWKRFIKR